MAEVQISAGQCIQFCIWIIALHSNTKQGIPLQTGNCYDDASLLKEYKFLQIDREDLDDRKEIQTEKRSYDDFMSYFMTTHTNYFT